MMASPHRATLRSVYWRIHVRVSDEGACERSKLNGDIKPYSGLQARDHTEVRAFAALPRATCTVAYGLELWRDKKW